MSNQPSTEVKTFTWNPTVQSYVLYNLQSVNRAGVKRFQTTVLPSRLGFRCRITATAEGFALIARLVAEIMASENLASAAPIG